MKFFTPGPTQLGPTVKAHIHKALDLDITSLSHRSKKFDEIFKRATDGLRQVMQIPQSHKIVFVASATEAFERTIQAGARKKTFHLVNGAFSERWFVTAKELGKEALQLEVPLGEALNLESVLVPSGTELLCMTHNESSTGVSQPMAGLEEIRSQNPNLLVSLDVVSSAPVFEVPWTLIDSAFFSVQKCFGLPAGLGVWTLSDKTIKRSDELKQAGISTGSYHSIESLMSFEAKCQTPETPNVLGIYLLGAVCEEMLKTGVEKIRAGILRRAADLYTFLDSSTTFSSFVKNKDFRSATVITVDVAGGAKQLASKLLEQGMEVGSGYGKLKDQQIRIANFPVHSDADFESLMKAIRLYDTAPLQN